MVLEKITQVVESKITRALMIPLHRSFTQENQGALKSTP